MTHARLSPTIFREYDIRGIAGEELTPEVARVIALAFAEWLREKRSPGAEKTAEGAKPGGAARAAVGRDNRFSSPELARAVAEGLAEAGWDVADLGVVPTPVFYFSRVRYGLDPGIMVTGSHNPSEYNGFKLAYGPGTLYGPEIADIGKRAAHLAERLRETTGAGAADAPGGAANLAAGARADAPRLAVGAAAAAGTAAIDPLPDYAAELRERVRLHTRLARPLRVAVDCGSGTASLVAPALLAELGCEVIPLYCELDGSFPGHWPDPSQPENLAELARLVRKERADVGLAFDGDADRLGVVDDQGDVVFGDILMILFWREILARAPGQRALVEVKCSQALVDEIRRLGGEPFFHRTGHSPIKATMRETGVPFAGEMSGHMFFADEYYGFDDAIYAAARLLRILSGEERPLSRLLADRPRYVATREVRLGCPDEVKFAVVESVRDKFAGEGFEVVAVDGARVIFPDGWLLVRASNTQPAIVARCEARSEEGLEALKASAVAALEETPMRGTLGAIEW